MARDTRMELDASRPGMWRSVLGSVVLLELSRVCLFGGELRAVGDASQAHVTVTERMAPRMPLLSLLYDYLSGQQ